MNRNQGPEASNHFFATILRQLIRIPSAHCPTHRLKCIHERISFEFKGSEMNMQLNTLWRDAKTGNQLAIIDFLAYVLLGFFISLSIAIVLGGVVLLLNSLGGVVSPCAVSALTTLSTVSV